MNRITITEKSTLLALLRAFVLSRPGFDPANYHTLSSYRADQRASIRDRDHALTLLSAAESDMVTAAHLRDALSSARRLSLSGDGQLEYCTGQYYCIEYRAAAVSALASAWWAAFRDNLTESPGRDAVTGDDIRKAARLRFGARIARRWFR